MTDTVKAFVETKFCAQGLFRGGAANSVWREP
jgi:hypothetical protein